MRSFIVSETLWLMLTWCTLQHYYLYANSWNVRPIIIGQDPAQIFTLAVSINVILVAIKIPQGIACCCKLSIQQRRHLQQVISRAYRLVLKVSKLSELPAWNIKYKYTSLKLFEIYKFRRSYHDLLNYVTVHKY